MKIKHHEENMTKTYTKESRKHNLPVAVQNNPFLQTFQASVLHGRNPSLRLGERSFQPLGSVWPRTTHDHSTLAWGATWVDREVIHV